MSDTNRTGSALRTAYLVASVAGIGFFILSVLLLGYWPKRVLDADASVLPAMSSITCTLMCLSDLYTAMRGRPGVPTNEPRIDLCRRIRRVTLCLFLSM